MTQKRPLIENPQTDPIFNESTETGLVEAAPVEPIASTAEPASAKSLVSSFTLRYEHRVEAAKTSIEDARQTQRDNAEKETASRNELQAARAALLKEFPPMTPAQNIRSHLRRRMRRAWRASKSEGQGITNRPRRIWTPSGTPAATR